MSRQEDCTTATTRGRLQTAEQFLLAAETIAEVLDQQDGPEVGDAYVTLCLHAGIAASDVICCKRLGVHAKGQDHDAAAGLLARVDRKASQQLNVLLNTKHMWVQRAPGVGHGRQEGRACSYGSRGTRTADLTAQPSHGESATVDEGC